jgi:hypothetical protein
VVHGPPGDANQHRPRRAVSIGFKTLAITKLFNEGSRKLSGRAHEPSETSERGRRSSKLVAALADRFLLYHVGDGSILGRASRACAIWSLLAAPFSKEAVDGPQGSKSPRLPLLLVELTWPGNA